MEIQSPNIALRPKVNTILVRMLSWALCRHCSGPLRASMLHLGRPYNRFLLARLSRYSFSGPFDAPLCHSLPSQPTFFRKSTFKIMCRSMSCGVSRRSFDSTLRVDLSIKFLCERRCEAVCGKLYAKHNKHSLFLQIDPFLCV